MTQPGGLTPSPLIASVFVAIPLHVHPLYPLTKSAHVTEVNQHISQCANPALAATVRPLFRQLGLEKGVNKFRFKFDSLFDTC
jgi:hypothetical protein